MVVSSNPGGVSHRRLVPVCEIPYETRKPEDSTTSELLLLLIRPSVIHAAVELFTNKRL